MIRYKPTSGTYSRVTQEYANLSLSFRRCMGSKPQGVRDKLTFWAPHYPTGTVRSSCSIQLWDLTVLRPAVKAIAIRHPCMCYYNRQQCKASPYSPISMRLSTVVRCIMYLLGRTSSSYDVKFRPLSPSWKRWIATLIACVSDANASAQDNSNTCTVVCLWTTIDKSHM